MAAGGGAPRSYVAELGLLTAASLAQLFRAPSHSRRADARRALARRWLGLAVLAAIALSALMVFIDVTVISDMPARGTPGLWPLRIFTDFAKSTYVLWALAILLGLVLIAIPLLGGTARPVVIALGRRIAYIYLAVLCPVLVGEVVKYVVGRGRPFVGGSANAFNYSHFAGGEAFASFPSGHATTAFALAFAVTSVWRGSAIAMWTFAVLICVSRVVLLAHHPSDVVAGALNGVVGAMFVRYWFAARRIGFSITAAGAIEPLPAASWGALKRVARGASAP